MPKDFRASQVRTTQIIASGSDAGKPSILIVSASDAAGYDGGAMDSSTLLGKVGTDVFMFVSGSDVKNSTSVRGVTVFGGDVVFSGTLYDGSGNTLAGGGAPASAKYVVMEADGTLSNETVLTAGNGIRVVNAGGTVTLTNTNMNLGWLSGSNIIYTTGSFGVGAANPRGELQIGDGTGSETLIIDSDGAKSGSILFVQDTGNPHAAIVLEADDNFILVQSASNKDIIFKTKTGSTEKLPFVIDGSRNQVLFLSGGAQTSTDEANSTDVAFFVSGARGDRSSATTRGTSLFGGDVVVSGALAVNPGKTNVVTSIFNNNDEAIRVNSAGVVVNESGHATNDFRVESDTKSHAIFVDAGTNQVLILSGGAQTSLHAGSFTDTNFYVSGAIKSRGSSDKGTSVFGGDLVVSGALMAEQGLSGSLTQLADGSSYIVAGDNVTITSASNGSVTIAASQVADGNINVGWLGRSAGQIDTTGSLGVSGTLAVAQAIQHVGETGNKIDFVNGQILFMSGGAQTSLNAASFGDTNFFVSGTVGSRGTGNKGTAVFGGDMLVSGTFVPANGISGSLTKLANGSSFLVAGDNVNVITASNGQVTISANIAGGGVDTTGWIARSAGVIDTTGSLGVSGTLTVAQAIQHVGESGNKIDFTTGRVLVLSGGAQTSPNEGAFNDVNFFVSGSKGTIGTATKGTALFGGDAVVSGTIVAVTGLSGSLTHLTNGKSYIRAGEHVTVATGTDGSITLSSTGPGTALVGWLGRSAGQIDTTGSLGVTGTLKVGGIQRVGETANKLDFATGQILVLSGGAQASPDAINFGDTNFFVSGSTGTRGTSSKGTSTFGGDIAVSGSSHHLGGMSGSLTHLTDGTSYLRAGSNVTITTGTNGSVTIASTGGGGSSDGNSNVGWLGRSAGQIDTTGSLGVTGTLKIAQAIQHIGETGNKLDFATGQVLVLSGGAQTSLDASTFGDTNFFVSGAIGDKGGASKGTSTFGGDVVVSGNVHLGEYIYHEADSDTFIRLQADDINIQVGGSNFLQFTEDGTQDKLIVNDAGADLDFVVETAGEDEAFLVDASANAIIINKGETAFSTSIRNINDEAVLVNANGVVLNEDGHATNDFRVETDTKTHALFVDAGNNKVVLGENATLGTDTFLYVSGGLNTKNGASPGVSVFAGDVVVSSSLTAQKGLSGSLTQLIDGTSYLVAGSNMSVVSQSNGQVTIAAILDGNTNVGWIGRSGGQIDSTGSVGVSGSIDAAEYIRHIGDTDTYIRFQTDDINVQAGGTDFIKITEDGSQDKIIFNEGGVDVDLRVETANQAHALFVEGASDRVYILSASSGTPIEARTDRVLILSGGAQTSLNAATFKDTNFFVSGAIGDRGTSKRGTAVFGGDTVSSGSVIGLLGLSGSLTQLTDGKSYLSAGSNVTITSASNGQVIIAASGGGSSNAPSVGWLGRSAGQIDTTGSLGVTGTLAVAQAIQHIGETGNKIDFATGQVLVLSGGAQTSLDASTFGDTNFFVSGAIGSKGSSAKGTSAFGGDVCISGTLYPNEIKGTKISGSLTTLSTGISYLIAGTNIGITSASNGQVTIAHTGGASTAPNVGWLGRSAGQIDTTGSLGVTGTLAVAQAIQHIGESGNKIDFATGQVLILSGGAQTSLNPTSFGDTNFFVSGAIGSKNSSTKGTSTFGGDLVVSGILCAAEYIMHGGDSDTFVRFTDDSLQLSAGGLTGLSLSEGSTDKVFIGNSYNQVLILSGGASTSADEAAGSDVAFFVSGAINDRGVKRGAALFGGEVVVSGTIHALGDLSVTGSTELNSAIIANTLNVGGGDGVTISDGNVAIKNAGSVSNVKFYCESSNAHYTQLQSAPHSEYASDVTLTMPPVTGRLLASTDAKIDEYLYHTADLDTYLRFEVDKAHLAAGGSVGLTLEEGSVDKVEIGSNYHKVLVLSGGAGTSVDGSAGNDVAFFVSGTIGSKGTSVKGVSVFGGDMCVSGTIFPAEIKGTKISGSLTTLSTGVSYIRAGSNMTVTTGTDGSITLAAAGGGSSNAPSVGWLGRSAGQIDTTGSLGVTGTLAVAQAIQHIGESGNKLDFTSGQVLVLSGGAQTSLDASTFGDTNFFVSGAIGKKGTAERGTAVFGGDVCISGTLYPNEIKGTKISGSLTTLSTGVSYLLAGSNITITSASNGQVSIAAAGGGSSNAPNVGWIGRSAGQIDTTGSVGVSGTLAVAQSIQHIGESGNKLDFTSGQVLVLSGGAQTSLDASTFEDTNFFVSGAMGSRATSSKGTAVFGGDIAVSGAMTVNPSKANLVTKIFSNNDEAIRVSSAGVTVNEGGHATNDFRVESDNNAHMLFVDAGNDRLGIGSVGASPATTVHIKDSSPTLRIQRNDNSEDSSIEWTGAAGHTSAILLHGGTNDIVLKTYDGSNPGETLRVTGGSTSPQMILLSGSRVGATSMQPKQATDLAFFVSGAIGKRGAAEKGTAVFGGDLVISGVQYNLNPLFSAVSGSLTTLASGKSFIRAGSNMTVTTGSDGSITLAAAAGADGDVNVGWFGRSNGQIDTTGSLGVSGTLAVAQAIQHIGESGNKLDFTSGQVLVLSGGAQTSLDASTFGDTNFFVSGAIGDAKGSTKSTAVFGGDVVVSGNVHVAEYIYHETDTDTFIRFTDDNINIQAGGVNFVNITEDGSQDIITFNEAGADIDFRVESSNEDEAIYLNAGSNKLHFNKGKSAFTTNIWSNNDNALEVNSSGIVLNEEGHASNDLRVESNLNTHALFVDSGKDQVLVLTSAAGPGGVDSADVSFYVSGALGRRGQSERGTSVFGGDTVVSGAMFVGHNSAGMQTLNVYGNVDGSYVAVIDNDQSSNGHILQLKTDGNGSGTTMMAMEDGDGDTLFKARADGRFGFGATGVSSMGAGTFVVGIDGGHTADIAISKRLQHLGDSNTYMDFPAADQLQFVVGGLDTIHVVSGTGTPSTVVYNEGGKDIDFRIESLNKPNAFKVDASTDQVLILSGGAQASPDEGTFGDVNFFVSGSVSTRGTSHKGTALFGGDLTISGSLIPGVDSAQDLGTANNRWANVYTGDLHLRNERGDWTIVEEPDYLCVINNLTGKKFKMDLTPIDDE
jgi:Trm5-related predicted tRNA methylase